MNNIMKSLDEMKKELVKQGYSEIYEWTDNPNYEYPSHKHDTDTTLIVLEGEITVTIEGKTKKYSTGETVFVPAHKNHYAKVGSKGASYLVGEERNR